MCFPQSPTAPFRVTGEKSAALRIVGFRQPDAAVRMALARLRHPDTPDRELYVPIVAAFAGDKTVTKLLETVQHDAPRRVVLAIGRELGRLGAETQVLQWLHCQPVKQRLAACRIAGFLPFTARLDAAVRALVDDADRRVADAAIEAHERLLRGQTATELVHLITSETDLIHRWVLVDALVSVADPEGDWRRDIRPFLTPALVRHLSEKLKERQKKLNEELDREDRYS
jgi:hypothetical protein